jgi:hypothetical protein
MDYSEFLKQENIEIEPEFKDQAQNLGLHSKWQILHSFISKKKEKYIVLINILQQQSVSFPNTLDQETEKHVESILFTYGLTMDSRALSKKGTEFEEYELFFDEVLKGSVRDKIDGVLKTKNEQSLWKPVGNSLEMIKSLAVDQNLKPHKIRYHFDRYQRTRPLKLLCKKEKWNGHDIIADMMSHVSCSNMTNPEMIELVKHWMANAIQRIDTNEQNTMILFQGSQGAGKDVFIENLCGGFDPYFANFTETSQEKDMFMQISKNMIINISEFDKLNRKHPGMIKDLISRKTAQFRPSHMQYVEDFKMIASFIGSVNPKDFLTDSTGNRRFWVFEDVQIDWGYPKGKGVQVFAQATELAREGYRASEATLKKMGEYVNEFGPENTDTLVADMWNESLDALVTVGRDRFNYKEVEHSINQIQKVMGYKSVRKTQETLKRLGAQSKIGSTRVYHKIKKKHH